MSKLPPDLSGDKVVKALERAGFYVKRRKGSHIVLRRDNPSAQVVVPDHKSVDTGTLAAVLHGVTYQSRTSSNLSSSSCSFETRSGRRKFDMVPECPAS